MMQRTSPHVFIHKSAQQTGRDAQTNLNVTVSLPVSSTVRQMIPAFFQLNTDLEIIIQVPAKYKFGDGG